MHPGEVIETKDQVFIKEIPRLEWGKDNDNSFIRSTQLALNAIGGNSYYDYLMGISGAAFKLQFKPGWCPSSADATTGFAGSVRRNKCVYSTGK